MCLILFAFKTDPKYPLIVLANRDEFYARPTRAAGYWNDFPGLYAGRDLVAGGTWLGVTDSGRFAALTNYREPSAPKGIRSRGELVAGFLTTDVSIEEYLRDVVAAAGEYSGFNLLVGEIIPHNPRLMYVSNRSENAIEIDPGVYGLSNHLLNTPWQKVEAGKQSFNELLKSPSFDSHNGFAVLSDKTTAEDADLPSTGLAYEAEKALSSIFIETPGYGTRCSTFLRFNGGGDWEFEEKTFV